MRSTSRPDQPRISVIVPTRDRPDALVRCLDALAAQTVVHLLEIVVVDDGSLAAAQIGRVVDSYAGAQLVRRGGGGPAAARNAGAAVARGTVLCFTDDDCAPHPDWVERLLEAFERHADVAAGLTLHSGGVLAQASELVARAPATAPAPEGSDVPFAPSNNFACRKAVFQTTLFDESYPTAAGEDRDWCARVTAAGFALRFQPTARIVHHQELTVVGFLRQQFRYGQGAFRFRRGSVEHRRLESAAFYLGLLRRAFTQGVTVGILVCVAQAATLAGFFASWFTTRRDARSLDVASS
jgi:GT2 family glycosyltransferase